MDERNEELERIQKGLLAQEDTISLRAEPSVDDILADEELNALLGDGKVPAFDDPEQIHDPKEKMQYHNYANDYGKDDSEEQARKNDKIQIGLMIASCVLCTGIIGILIYWLNLLP